MTMRITVSTDLPVPVGFLLHIGEDGFSVAVYHLARKDDPETLLRDGGDIDAVLIGLAVAVSTPVHVAYDDLRQRPEFSDHGLWALPLREHDSRRPLGLPFNRAAETLVTKRTREESLRRQENVPVRLLVPFRNSAFADCTLHVATHPDHPLVVNGTPEAMDLQESIARAMPVLRLHPSELTVPTDGYGVAGVAVTNRDGRVQPAACDLYLEETGGYLPKRRIQVVDGRAAFKVGALGLDAGETFRVKVGFRHFSGLADLNVTVV
jgi:hypothetical protein